MNPESGPKQEERIEEPIQEPKGEQIPGQEAEKTPTACEKCGDGNIGTYKVGKLTRVYCPACNHQWFL